MSYFLDPKQLQKQYLHLWNKLDILCRGIKRNDLLIELYAKQNPHTTERTGNNGLQILLEPEKFPLNVAVSKKFCLQSPYTMEKDNAGNLFLRHALSNALIPISCPDVAPFWYQKRLFSVDDNYSSEEIPEESLDKVVGDLIVLEGEWTAIASITDGCVYINNNVGCKFCAIGKEKPNNELRKKKLLEAISIMAEDPQIKNFHLTGGNDYTDDRGALKYIPFIKQIKKYRSDAKIAAEFTPPKPIVQKAVFEKLREAGADSITMNIEFWNDTKRIELMPYKGMIPKEDYLSAFEVGLEVFGPNKVTCGFIVGLEPLSDTMEGIRTVTERKIIAEVYPYKPNDGAILATERPYPTDTEVIMKASLYADDRMKANNIHPDKCSGCVRCGACGITQELNKITNEQKMIKN